MELNKQPWRPKVVYHYIQSNFIEPDFIVDISNFMEIKMQAIKAFKTQFYDPESKEPETYISNPGFLKMLEARATEFGHAIGAKFGEGFTVRRYPGVNSSVRSDSKGQVAVISSVPSAIRYSIRSCKRFSLPCQNSIIWGST